MSLKTLCFILTFILIWQVPTPAQGQTEQTNEIPVTQAVKIEKSNLDSQGEEIPVIETPKELIDVIDIPVEVISNEKDVPNRTLFIEFNKIEQAHFYEIDIRPYRNSFKDPYRITTSKDKIRFRMPPGRYEIRARSLIDKTKPGAWDEWRSFWVPFKSVANVYPSHGTIIEPKSNVSEKLVFEWPVVPSAKAYRLKIYDKNGRMVRHIITEQTWVSVLLDINSRYTWSLTPMASPKEPDRKNKNTSIQTFVIMKPEPILFPIKVTADYNPKATYYQFELTKVLDNDDVSEPTLFDSREAEMQVRMAPAEYEVRARAFLSTGEITQWGPPKRVLVHIPDPDIPPVLQKMTVDADDDERSNVVLSWQPMKNAHRYQIFIFQEDGKLVVNEELKQPTYMAQLQHDTKYRWTVKALLKNEERHPPPPSSDAKFTFTINEYIRLSLGQSEEPSQLYSYGKYIVSAVDYKGDNWDNVTQVSQNIFNSIGEAGLGYWHRKTSYGILGSATVSYLGFLNTNYYYYAVSLFGGYRKIYNDAKRMRIWFGLTSKQLPEVQYNSGTSQFSVKYMESLGPEFRIAWLDRLKGDWGYQLYGQLFFAASSRTPNGLSANSVYQISLSSYFTRRLPANMIAMLGYTFQHEQGSYNSADSSGNPNTFRFSGHFLSASLVWGLQEPMK